MGYELLNEKIAIVPAFIPTQVIKDPNWKLADQLVMHRCSRGVEPGTIPGANPSGDKSWTCTQIRWPNIQGWFTRATQTQTQAQANRRVNYHDANANASASADAKNGKFFISLRFRLHFLRVNRINANANANANASASARWKILVRERSEISCSFRKSGCDFQK